MAKLSPMRAAVPLLAGLQLLSRGKVRDTYLLPGFPDLLLQVATDGISIFDFVLNALILGKGIILNAMNHFWLQYLRNFGIETHFVAAGAEIDQYLPESLRGDIDVQSRAMVVRRLEMDDKEFIGRAYLTGSALKSYLHDGTVCGHQLPLGLQDGDALPNIIDTPTTKAQEGHDENLDAAKIRQQYLEQTSLLLEIFGIASRFAKFRGIILADTKLEFAGKVLCDEALTPDSSRYWELRTWEEGRKISTNRKSPPPYDKEIVRGWGIKQGINKLDPLKPEDVASVQAMEVPGELTSQTARIYRYIFWRLIGVNVDKYCREKMGIRISRNVKHIAVLCGSPSDEPLVRPIVEKIPPTQVKVTLHTMSCHRNPLDVAMFAKYEGSWVDAIIAVGGKAFALPGVLDAWLHEYKKDIPVIGVALGDPGSKSLEAARISIEELPDTPVVIDEITGKCYVGQSGLSRAIERVVDGELPLPKPRVEKPVRMEVFKNF